MVSVCVFVTDIHGLQPGQPPRGAGRGATTFYTSSVDAWCSLGPNDALGGPEGDAQGTPNGPNRPGQWAQDLQGRLTVSEGHGSPLVKLKLGVQVGGRLLIATHLDQSNYLPNQK
jgi:hypothetical protein